MHRIIALLVVFACFVNSADARPPNIVFILADDVGCETLGCYGGESYATPQIDKLAKDGMRFNHCYSMPVCHPTRVTFLSGRYPSRLGNPGWGSYPKPEEARTIASVLKGAGYATAVAGKWQLQLLKRDPQQPHRMGFDEYSVFGWHEGPRFYDPMIYQNGEVLEGTEGKYGPTLYVDFLTDFMKRNQRTPFFAFYSMALCHDVTDDIKGLVPFAPGKDHYDTYAEMMDLMDLHVGMLLESIDKLGLRDNTIVIFTTDNGTASSSYTHVVNGKMTKDPVFSVQNGKKIRGGKGSLTDGGTHVPLIVRWPKKVKAGEVVEHLVDFTDFYATFAELAEAKTPENVSLDGHSFAPLLTGGDFTPRAYAIAEGKRGSRFARTQRYKLYANGRLFDLQADPAEKKPLGENPPAEAKQASAVLAAGLAK